MKLATMALAIGASLWLAPASGGDTSDPVWTCRASLAYLNAPGQDPGRLEPVVANGGTAAGEVDRAQCVDDDAGFPELAIGGEAGDPGKITIQAPFARTRIDGDVADARTQTAGSAAGTAKVSIADADGNFVLAADVTEAGASGACTAGAPALAGTSRVANLTLNGTPIPLEDALVPIVGGINGSPLGMLLRISLNEEVAEGDAGSAEQALTRRALHVQLFQGDGRTTVLEAVVGESRIGRRGTVCAPPAPCPAGTTETGRNPDGSLICTAVVRAPCPPGTAPDASGACVRVVVVTRPEDVLAPCPAGQVRDITGRCRGVPRNRCAPSAFGGRAAILGTNRRDLITGTNRPDRILALGGSDRVSGGRGSDCIEGASGNDNLDGSNGNDLLLGGSGRDIANGGTGRDRQFGESGNDKLVGGSGNDTLSGGRGRDRLSGGLGNDRLFGGPGKDYINTGNGRDMVSAGSGNDVINASTAGPAARIHCGSGIDTLRINTNEQRRHSGCERVLVAVRRR